MAYSWSFGKSFERPAAVATHLRVALPVSATPDAVASPVPGLGAQPVRDPGARARLWLIFATFAMLLAFIVMLVLDLRGKSAQADLADVTGDLLMHSQRLAKAAPAAVGGDVEALAELRDSRDRMKVGMATLGNSSVIEGGDVRTSAQTTRTRFNAIVADWQATQSAAAVILDNGKTLSLAGAALRRIDAISPALAEASDTLATARLQGNAQPRDVVAATQLQLLNQRLARRANDLESERTIPQGWATAFSRDVSGYRDAVNALLAGARDSDARDKAAAIQKDFANYEAQIATIGDALPGMAAAKQSLAVIARTSEPLRNHVLTLRDGSSTTASTWTYGTVVTGVLALMGILVIARSFVVGAAIGAEEARRGRSLAEQQEDNLKSANEANQAAILRLMNELQEVADGNLTMQATVSEDITGAIADSINYTVEELRLLVGRINSTVQQVTGATSAAEETSKVLLTASDAQSREIRSTGDSVLAMARQISEVSGSAAESATVARQSLAAAEDGQRAVQNSITGMNEIREQIQETSKRIKRLGESSQEIGEIIELISDITEQTNVLALNAAIQAASAGEAGRGFSVVAEEVQRLAERSGEATKQIGALVRTIQTDTQDAVAAMEKSTEGVVEGAKLSDAAGQSLSNIGRVSRQLAELIEAISRDTSVHAQSAGSMASNMEHMLVVNEQTSEGTRRTAASIGQLGSLALELKNSVARFTVG